MCVFYCLSLAKRFESVPYASPRVCVSHTPNSPSPPQTLALQELPRQPFVFVSTPYSLSSAAENRDIIGMWAFERSLRGKLREELRPLIACGTVIAVPNSDESTYEKDEADGTSRHILGKSEWGRGQGRAGLQSIGK